MLARTCLSLLFSRLSCSFLVSFSFCLRLFVRMLPLSPLARMKHLQCMRTIAAFFSLFSSLYCGMSACFRDSICTSGLCLLMLICDQVTSLSSLCFPHVCALLPAMAPSVPMTVTALAGSASSLCRPCVDCGRYTGSFCDNDCLAQTRVPSERWTQGQRTPHCTSCEDKYIVCHFCRQQHWTQPPPWGPRH